MSIGYEAHDPSVGVRRRHLPSFAGEEVMTTFESALVLSLDSTRRTAATSRRRSAPAGRLDGIEVGRLVLILMRQQDRRHRSCIWRPASSGWRA